MSRRPGMTWVANPHSLDAPTEGAWVLVDGLVHVARNLTAYRAHQWRLRCNWVAHTGGMRPTSLPTAGGVTCLGCAVLGAWGAW